MLFAIPISAFDFL